MTELTDLEGAALAEIDRCGSTTSYAVAKSFASSPSEFWSGSAGAVYPLIKRLCARRLLRATRGKDGKRARTDYSLTTAGHAALRGWLLDARRAAGIGFDPLRTRAVHLDRVSAHDRTLFLSQVRAHLHEAAARDAWPDSPRLQAIHATVMTARKAWLAALESLLLEPDATPRTPRAPRAQQPGDSAPARGARRTPRKR